MKSVPVIFFILLAAMVTKPSAAAKELDFATVDLLTYRCFLEKKWDSVILVGKQALKLDIDYYYLRVRMGIAFYEKADYFPAATHLKKAMQFNSGDPVIADYLYYSYINSNRNGEAGLLKPVLTAEARKHAGAEAVFVKEVRAEGGYTISSDRNPDNLATLMEQDSIYGEQDLYGNNLYSNLGFRLRVSDRVSVTASYNYLSFSKTRYVQYGRAEAHLDTVINNIFSRDYFYSFPWKTHDTSFSYKVSQHEGYLNATVFGPWNVKICPAAHLLHVAYPVITSAVLNDSVSDTAYYSRIDSTYQMFSYPSVTYTFIQKDTSFNNWVVSLLLSKDLGIFSIGLSGSWSNLNNKKQKQAGLSLTYYPLGNLNFYGTTHVTGFFQGNDRRLLLSQVLGAKITAWMWGEANFYYGDYTNANIFNGSIVYNNSDIINYRAGGTLLFLVGGHLRLSLIYQFFSKESRQLYYIKSEDPATHEINEIPRIKNNPYKTNTLIGGITWKF